MKHIFLSYSRRQLYAAELLALRLQGEKIEVWFDLQKLYPGCDWQAEIEKGLAGCDSLLLLASRASLASPYVEKEWRSALEAGKPVIVVAYETVHLPDELRDRPVVDLFAGDYFEKIEQVVDYFKRPTKTSDTLARFALRAPRSAKWITAAFLAPVVPALAISLVEPPNWQLAGWGAAGVLLYLAWKFFTHRMPYNELQRSLFWVNAIAFPMLVFAGMLVFFGLFSLQGLFGLMSVICLLVPLIVYRRGLSNSEALLLWLPPDNSPQQQALRKEVHQHRAAHAPAGGARIVPGSYQLYYAAGDEKVVRGFGENVPRVNLAEQASNRKPLCIALLSSRTPQQDVIQLLDQYPRFIGIVVSPIRVGQEASHLFRYQMVDMRDGNRNRLSALLQSNAQQALETVPSALHSLRTPVPLTILMMMLRVLGTLFLAQPLLFLLPGGTPLVAQPPPIMAALYVFIGLAYFVLVQLILQRCLNFRWVAGSVAGLAVAGFMAGFGAYVQLIFAVTSLAALAYAGIANRYWFPTTTQLISHTPTLLVRSTGRIWLVNAIIFIVGFLLIHASIVQLQAFALAVLVALFAYLFGFFFRKSAVR